MQRKADILASDRAGAGRGAHCYTVSHAAYCRMEGQVVISELKRI